MPGTQKRIHYYLLAATGLGHRARNNSCTFCILCGRRSRYMNTDTDTGPAQLRGHDVSITTVIAAADKHRNAAREPVAVVAQDQRSGRCAGVEHKAERCNPRCYRGSVEIRCLLCSCNCRCNGLSHA